MDKADAWLREHDPDYAESRKAWRHLNDDGEYVRPWREDVEGGLAPDIEARTFSVKVGERAYWLHTNAASLAERSCAECGRKFMPFKGDHWYCHARCYRRAYMRKWRAKGGSDRGDPR